MLWSRVFTVPLSLASLAIVLACDARPATTTPTTTPAACPKCECKCSCPDGPGAVGGTTTPAGSQEEIEELTYGLSRKIAKHDATCLADLDRLAKLAPRTEARMQMLRGQCLMMSGKCTEGSAMVRKEMKATTELLDEQLDRTVESFASMYCKGPLDDRGELLRAVTDLQKGAYQGNIGVRACTDAAKTVARLRGRVRPKDDEDYQIISIPQSFGYAAAGCLARAGDCAGAWKVFTEETQSFASIPDATVRAEAMRTAFDSTVPKCKGKR